MDVDLSIILVNYNTRDLLVQCLRSVMASKTSRTFEVLLVDNASMDGSVAAVREAFPQVRILENERNEGFARANNRAIAEARGRYVLLLNSDTQIQPDTIDTMIRCMDAAPSVGAAGCRVCLPDGRLDPACKRGFPRPLPALCYMIGLPRLFPRNPTINGYLLSHLDPDEEHAVDCLTGAFMMVRREAIDQVGMLDPTYFMYGEDIDWCLRIRQAGWEIRYCPATRITHYKGGSNQHRANRIVYEFYRAMHLFYREHFAREYSWPINALVYTAIWLAMLGALCRNMLRRLRPRAA